MKRPDFRLIEGTLKELDFPKLAIIEVISVCNLRCIMCPQKNMDKKPGKMKFYLWKKIIDEIAERSPWTEVWPAIMGEPLLMGDDLLKMIGYATGRGIRKIMLNTNAALLDRRMSRRIAEVGVKQVIFGLDAATEKTYRRIRVGGDFNRVTSNIMYLAGLLRKKGLRAPTLIAQFIEMDENTKERVLFKEMWLERGVAVKIRPKLGWGYGVAARNLDFSQRKRIPCPWLMRTMSVHYNGRVAQCDADYEGHFYAGDLNYQTIDEVWNGELKRRRKLHWERRFPSLPCGKCNDWKAGLSEFYFPDEPEKVIYKTQLEGVDRGEK